MCFAKMPKPVKPPALPNMIDDKIGSMRNAQQRRGSSGGTFLTDTNVTGGKAGASPVYTPAAGNSTILGSG